MLLIRCPYCEEERPELEFRNAGEAHVARPENIAAESEVGFESYFFQRSNPRGPAFERWRHLHGCGRFFNAARDTVTDRFLVTYKAGEPKPDLARLIERATPKVAPAPEASPADAAKEKRARKNTARKSPRKGDA